MKKILSAFFLVLMISCLYAHELKIYDASINENTSINDYTFFIGLESIDEDELVALYLPPDDYCPTMVFVYNSFIEQCYNITDFGYFVIYPVSFSFSEENPSQFPLLFELYFDSSRTDYDPVDNPAIYLEYGYSTKMVELISALLNDGFVIFDLEYTILKGRNQP